MVLLAATSGALDALGFLALGGVFASVMTGNLVLLGLGIGSRNGGLLSHAVVAVSAYTLGVAVGAGLTRGGAPVDIPGWSRKLHVVIAVELGLLVVFTGGWELVRSRSSSPAQLVLIALAATAMGLQGAAMRVSTRNRLSTTYLTGTLTGIVAGLAGGGRLGGEWMGVAVLGAALAGAAVAGAVLTERAALAPVVPLLALAGALVAGRTLARDGRAEPSAA